MDTVDIEIVVKNSSPTSKADIIEICKSYLSAENVTPGSIIAKFDKDKHMILYDDVDYIVISESNSVKCIDTTSVHINWYVYKLDQNGPQTENCEEDNSVNLQTQYILPSADLFSLWENLIFDVNIKENLLKYAHTMVEFSNRGVDTNVISCNRVILLHGPPGTGKTSLCKALAQKLCIKMQKRFRRGILIEINSHSLFSKWFSESGKLVSKMFTKIKEIVEEPKTLVCVLIDEIESLAHARQQCMSGNEPSDSIRVVNAVLTQIDQIKSYPNVIILTTSNMTAAIDIAFVDRADIKQYLGLPGIRAIYQIYHTCIEELLKVGIIQSREILHQINLFSVSESDMKNNSIYGNTKYLIELSEKSLGLSGRTLRRIPFLTHALYLQHSDVSLNEFLKAMDKAIDHEKEQRKHFYD